MSYVSNIVDAFGGVRPMAKKIGYPISTVMSWKARGSIPDEHKPRVFEVAVQNGFALSKADFFPGINGHQESQQAGAECP